MPFKPEKREYRNLTMPLKVERTEKRFNTDFYVEGYATTFDKPYMLYEIDGVKYYEQVDRHALNDADLSDVIMQFDHRGTVFARNSNGTLGLKTDEHGFFIYADLSKSDSARALHQEIAAELIKDMSWCFAVSKRSYDSEKRLITIEKVSKVYDVSAVSIPANKDTEISARTFLEGSIQEVEELQELQERQELSKRRKILEMNIKLGGFSK